MELGTRFNEIALVSWIMCLSLPLCNAIIGNVKLTKLLSGLANSYVVVQDNHIYKVS